jgi:8-oxo-dGTP pyrophosphatase MutT (NUDIX family)
METTRHFTATVYVVCDGATALHDHAPTDKTIPPGGHVDRDELPHETGLREVEEELGLQPTLVDDTDPVGTPDGRRLPQPRHQMLYDIDEAGGEVVHQHVDHVYYATVPSRDVDPGPGEEPAEVWEWFTPAELRARDLPANVVDFGLEAIAAAKAEE